MSEKISIGLLDFGYRGPKRSSEYILKDVINYALQADKLGLKHLWLGEHHGGNPAWSNPTMLLPVLAGMTERLNIGIAGILLKYYSAYSVCLDFKMLASLFPGRIDLGLANGGIEEKHKYVFSQINMKNPGFFDEQVEKMASYFNRNSEVLENQLPIVPDTPDKPALWRLSQSFKPIQHCIDQGLHLSVSTFHESSSIEITKEKLNEYRELFYQKHKRKIEINIAFNGYYSESTNLNTAGLYSDDKVVNVIGNADTFKEKILFYSNTLGINSFTFLDVGIHRSNRLKTLEILADMNNMSS